MIKVLSIVFRFFPERGGSETYTRSLGRELKRIGYNSIFLTLGQKHSEYTFETFIVKSVPYNYCNNPKLFREFLLGVVDQECIKLVHFHYIPFALDCFFLKELKNNGVKLFFTFHHPSVLCAKGDFITFGVPCNKDPLGKNCFPCLAHTKGVPRISVDVVNLFPNKVLLGLSKITSGKVKTLFSLRNQLDIRYHDTIKFLSEMNKIFVLAEWTKEKLLNCGIPDSKVLVNRLGTHIQFLKEKAPVSKAKTRLIFVGRLDKVKGVEFLLSIFADSNFPNIEFDIYGPLESAPKLIKDKINRDDLPRFIKYKGFLPDESVCQVMANYDAAVIPSMSFETGPYTVIEAFQVGLPVIGTDIPGISELVGNNVTGILIPFGNRSAWLNVFKEINDNQAGLDVLKRNIGSTRTMHDVALDVTAQYQEALREIY